MEIIAVYKQAFFKVPLHLAGDATDRMKLLMPIYFLNEEAKINLLPECDPGPTEFHGSFFHGCSGHWLWSQFLQWKLAN